MVVVNVPLTPERFEVADQPGELFVQPVLLPLIHTVTVKRDDDKKNYVTQ